MLVTTSSPTENLHTTSHVKIWAIGGGKGGVGKSLVTANTSICLALMGYKVVTVDLDLGGANLHTCLGIPIPEYTLSDYVSKKVDTLEEIVIPTTIKNLSIISGAQDEMGMANLQHIHKTKIISQLRELDCDYVLLDLGAGTTSNTLDFFISADQGILTTLPEPTSIENTYRFIRSIFHRKIKSMEDMFELGPMIDSILNSKIHENMPPSEIINKVKEINPELGYDLEMELSRFNPRLIINQVRTQSDIDVGHSMKIICKKYFGIQIEYSGYLEYDAAVWQSVKRRRPLLMEFPNSNLVFNFDRIVHSLLNVH